MSNELMQVLLAAISFLGIIATGIFAWKARQTATEVKNEVKEVVSKVTDYHAEVNGKISKLLESKDKETEAKVDAAGARGELKGAEDNQARTDEKEQENK